MPFFHTFTMLFQKVSRIGERKFRKYYHGNTFQACLFLFFHSNFYFMPRWIWPCLPPFQWNLLLFTILDSLFTFSFHIVGLALNFYNFGFLFYFLFSLHFLQFWIHSDNFLTLICSAESTPWSPSMGPQVIVRAAKFLNYKNQVLLPLFKSMNF